MATYLAKTMFGLENVLAEELKTLGASNILVQNRAVKFSGDTEILYRANMYLRTALHVLMQLADFEAPNEDVLYNKAFKVEWEKYFSIDKTFAIDSVVFSPIYKNSAFISLKVKDAIVDRFRSRFGKRPDVDPENPDIKIHVHIAAKHVTLSLDSSGTSLYKRGYRKAMGKASISEVLAAGMVLLSGWTPDIPLINPMCGSGTILTEAALIAARIPPGIFRKNFSFEKWLDFDDSLLRKIYNEEPEEKPENIMLYGSDIDKMAIEQTLMNVKGAAVSKIVNIQQMNFIDSRPPVSEGIIIMNPPYGERMKVLGIEKLYQNIGSTLKHNYSGFKVWILSSSFESMKNIGLKPIKKLKLYNGNLECTYNEYALYEGSLKENKNNHPL